MFGQSVARKQYCDTVEELIAAEQRTSRESVVLSDYQDISITDQGGARIIFFNRPHKLNSLTYQVMYMWMYKNILSVQF